jgi:hypothetical protein
MPSSTLDTEIVIDRPPEIVKAVFMDWPRYPLWNPFITSLSLLKGDIDHPSPSVTQLKVSIKVDDNKPWMTFTTQLLINTNTNEFRWVGTVYGKWFLAGEHWFQFLPLDNGTKTRFVQGECFTGLGVSVFKLMVSVENTRKGFIAMNEALKKEAEAK